MNTPNEHHESTITPHQEVADTPAQVETEQHRSRRGLIIALGGIGAGVVLGASIAGALFLGHGGEKQSDAGDKNVPQPDDKQTSLSPSESPSPSATETAATPETETVPASVKKLDSDTLLQFENADEKDRLTWLTWAMKDMQPFVDRFERVSIYDTDKLAPVSTDNTGAEILARRAYYERYAYSLTLANGDLDVNRAQKIMYASTYLQGNSGQATVINIIQTMEKNPAIPVDTQALKEYVSTDNKIEKVGKLYKDSINGIDPAQSKAVKFTDADGNEKQVIAYYVPTTDYEGNPTTVMITSELLNADEFARY